MTSKLMSILAHARNNGIGAIKMGSLICLKARDLGHNMSILLQEAVISTTAVYEDEPEKMEILDTIANMFLIMYCEATKNHTEGIKGFRTLYEYLEEEGEEAKEVYATFTGMFLQAVFSLLFTAPELAIGIPAELNTELGEHVAIRSLLSNLDDDLAPKVMEQFRARGMWPTTVDYSRLLRRSEDYLKLIKDDQKERMDEAIRLADEQGDKHSEVHVPESTD